MGSIFYFLCALPPIPPPPLLLSLRLFLTLSSISVLFSASGFVSLILFDPIFDPIFLLELDYDRL